MAHHLTLNCPTCRKRLTYVPLDGLTLHFYCQDHGLLILKPLVQLSAEDSMALVPATVPAARHSHDAA